MKRQDIVRSDVPVDEALRGAANVLANNLNDLFPVVTKHVRQIALESKPKLANGKWDTQGLANIFRVNTILIGYMKEFARIARALKKGSRPNLPINEAVLVQRLREVEKALEDAQQSSIEAKTTREIGGVVDWRQERKVNVVRAEEPEDPE